MSSSPDDSVPQCGTLEDIGIPGRNYLREALTSCTDPLKAIEDFQLQNGILLPSLRPMLPLLDLHGIRRYEFHQSVLEDLRDRLINSCICDASSSGGNETRHQDKLRELLEKSFPVVKIKQLRPVIMAILKKLDVIDRKYLNVLESDKELYSECDIEIKRHLWRENQSLFGDEVSPYFGKYITSKEHVLYGVASHHHHADSYSSIASSNSGPGSVSANTQSQSSTFSTSTVNSFFALAPKTRRQSAVVDQLTQMIGKSIELYDMTLQFLRTLFLRTRNVHYCTLRVELLMALHDLEVQEIVSVDPCHKFAWCLDACVREKNVDAKRSRELQGFLDSIPEGEEDVLIDLAMIVCDPYALNFLVTSSYKILIHQIEREAMARDNMLLHTLLRMISFGLSAWNMIKTSDKKSRRLQFVAAQTGTQVLVTRFVASLMCLMVDDQVRSVNNKMPIEERETAQIVIEHSGPPPDAFQQVMESNSAAILLAMQHTIHTAKCRDNAGLCRVLTSIAPHVAKHPYEGPFLHVLITHLSQNADEFDNEDFCVSVFDTFFSVLLTSGSGSRSGSGNKSELHPYIRHLMRLIGAVYYKITSVVRLTALLDMVRPLVNDGPIEAGADPAMAAYMATRSKVVDHIEFRTKLTTEAASEARSSDLSVSSSDVLVES